MTSVRTLFYTALIAALSFLGSSTTHAAGEYYWDGNTRHEVSRVISKVAVQFVESFASRSPEAPNFIHSCLAGASEQSALPRTFYLYDLNPSCSYQTAFYALAADSVVRRIVPVYVAAGGKSELRVTDLVTVQLREDVDPSQRDSVLSAFGLELVRSSEFKPNLLLCALADTMPSDPLGAGNAIHLAPETEWACASFSRHLLLHGDPTDWYYPAQYYLKNTGQCANCTPGVDMDADSAWMVVLGSTPVKVAVIDDGVTGHIDLPAVRILPGYDAAGTSAYWVDDYDFDPRPGPKQGHGMACAGIIGASHNDSGIVGVNGSVELIPIKILDDGLENDTAYFGYDWEIAAGLRAAAALGAQVISSSWTYVDATPSPEVAEAIRDIARPEPPNHKQACVLVFASGNLADSTHPCLDSEFYFQPIPFPANMNEVIAVGAIKPNDSKWNYGCWGNALDVSAVTGDMCYQGDIYTMDQEGAQGVNPYFTGELGDIPNGYWTRLFGGTSAACPQVAGIAALILARRPDLDSVLTPQCDSGIVGEYLSTSYASSVMDDECPDSFHIVRQIITKTATRRLNGTWNPLYGYGRATAFYALLAVMHGDLNNDLQYDAVDLNLLINQAFFNGHGHFHDSLGDVNCDGAVDINDVTYLSDVIFFNGSEPPVCLKYPAP